MLGYARGVTDRAQINVLISQGQLAEAAALLEEGGELAEALKLYEQLWDFVGAARVARLQGDFARALANILRGRDPALLDAFVAELSDADEATLERCAEVFAERGVPLMAARLRERLEQYEAAADLYEQAGDKLAAARLREHVGQHRRALELYRTLLDDGVTGADAAIARLDLGKLLLRYGRAADAVPLLQVVALEDPSLLVSAARATAAALWRAGYPHAAKVALEQARECLAAEPTAAGSPPDGDDGAVAGLLLEDCLADPSLAPLESDEADHTVLAGRYRLGELRGSGGMGRVYDARDLLAGQRVAVKVFTAPGGVRGRDAYQRFVREALSTGKLDHPHIVRLLDFNEDMGFMVLEYMEGGTLAERLRPRLPLSTTRSIALQVLDGLAAAHQRGIVHRDLKPSNIFFTAVGAAKLGDFGVAHLQDSGQTQTGAFIGTLAYMSPEQILGEPVSFATDIYALGVTLFLMLTGRLPFEPPDLVDKHLNAEPPRPSALVSGLPAICDETVLRCLAKRPDQRHESLAALRAQITRFRGRGTTGRMRRASSEPEAPEQRSTDSRFTIEAQRFVTPALELLDARDNELTRPVMLVRIAPGPLREPLERLLKVAAGADIHLQEVLAYGPMPGNGVLELPTGTPLTLPWQGDPFDFCSQLLAALGPLHAQGLGHGALCADTITERGGYLQLSVTAALIDLVQRHEAGQPPASPAADLVALSELMPLSLPASQSAAELAAWLRREEARHRQQVWTERLQRALSSAPPGVDRGVEPAGEPELG